MKLIIFLALILFFIASCNYSEAENLTGKIENTDFDSEIMIGDKEGGDDMSKTETFDIENAIKILREALPVENPREISDEAIEDAFIRLVIEPLRIAGVRGVITAEWIEFEFSLPVLEVISEDNRTYWLHTHQNQMTKWHAISAIVDRQTGEVIFVDDPGHVVPAPTD